MLKTHQKKIASFVLGALLVMVAGFCAGLTPIANAHVSKTESVALDDCGGQTNTQQKNDGTVREKSSADSSILPCCIDRHESTPSIESLYLSGMTKIVATSDLANLNVISIDEKNINFSVDSSPPKADKLSSILRLE